jgi:hypothetical protein
VYVERAIVTAGGWEKCRWVLCKAGGVEHPLAFNPSEDVALLPPLLDPQLLRTTVRAASASAVAPR